MREIKFKFEHLGELFDVYEINFDTQKVIVDNGDIFEISQGHLIQFTGKTDKNGKEIYNGDQVKHEDSSPCPQCGFMHSLIAEVKYDEESCAYKLVNADGESYLMNYDSEELEVIGNIHDNPDLLKQ